jgi:hypothetical protein
MAEINKLEWIGFGAGVLLLTPIAIWLVMLGVGGCGAALLEVCSRLL